MLCSVNMTTVIEMPDGWKSIVIKVSFSVLTVPLKM